MAKVGLRTRINVCHKTYEAAQKYSEEFRSKDNLNGYITYLFEDDVNVKQLLSEIEDNEMFYIMDFTRCVAFNVTKVNELLFDINVVRFDDIRIPYIYGSKGIKITIKQGVKEYIPCIMGKKGEYWI